MYRVVAVLLLAATACHPQPSHHDGALAPRDLAAPAGNRDLGGPPGDGGAPSFTVGGTVSGLAHPGLVLQDNGRDDLTLTADGAFTFAAALPDGSGYAVTVASVPENVQCSVSSGSGTIAGAAITNVTVACSLTPLPALQPLGVDMPGLLIAYLGLPGDHGNSPLGRSDALHQLDLAQQHGFTHARIMGAPYWPIDMLGPSGWVNHPDVYFAAFDALVADARARGVRLVPSLLFNGFLFPDVAGEPRSKLFTPGSKTRMLAEQYITDVVTRYKDSDAILFWEVGNEYNLDADLDFAGCATCTIAPTLGTPTQRSSDDDFHLSNAWRGVSSMEQDLGGFFHDIGALIHAIDNKHPVSNGCATQRPWAYHLAVSPVPPGGGIGGAGDGSIDTPAQYQSVLAQLGPPGIDLLSVHYGFYPDFSGDNARFGDWDIYGSSFIARTQQIAAGLGKPLYVGEIGEPRAGTQSCTGVSNACGGDVNRAGTQRAFDNLVVNNVAWGAVWAFEWYDFCPASLSCTSGGSDDPIWTSLATHNQAYGSCAGKSDGTSCPIGVCSAQICVLNTKQSAPSTLGAWAFQSAAALNGWTTSTPCGGCNTSFALVGNAYVELQSPACASGCGTTEVDAFSPRVAVTSGHVTARFKARTSDGKSHAAMLFYDSGGTVVGGRFLGVDTGGTFTTSGWTMPVPANTATVGVTLTVPTLSATLDVDSIELFAQP